jgi:hypothetical protein
MSIIEKKMIFFKATLKEGIEAETRVMQRKQVVLGIGCHRSELWEFELTIIPQDSS